MDIAIIPGEKRYIDDCIRVAIRAYESVHQSYAACIGEEMHDKLMGDWCEEKAASIRADWTDGAFVALADGQVAGYVLYRAAGICGQFRDNAVDPALWGHGLSAMLCEAALDTMRSAGCKYAAAKMGLDEGQAGARHLFSKLGFDRNLPSIMYYQKLDTDMEPYATSSDTVQVIPCEEKHLDDCARIALTAWEAIHNVYIQHQGQEMHDALNAGWRERLVKDVRDGQMQGHGYVAIVDGKVAGFAAYRLEDKMGVVSRNAVDPAYRGRGIAKLLYGQLINGMIAAGHRYARVHTGLDDGHAGARNAYGKVGFRLNLPTATYYKEL